MKQLAPITVVLLSACTTFQTPIPKDYSGPTATIEDTWSLDVNERDQVFAVLEVDGASIRNAVSETRQASQNRGFQTIQRSAGRAIAARRLNLKLVGTHFSAAPIGEIARRAAGTFQSVEGTVVLDAKEGERYKAMGELSKAKSCVWIAIASTGAPATEKVCTP